MKNHYSIQYYAKIDNSFLTCLYDAPYFLLLSFTNVFNLSKKFEGPSHLLGLYKFFSALWFLFFSGVFLSQFLVNKALFIYLSSQPPVTGDTLCTNSEKGTEPSGQRRSAKVQKIK